MVAKHDPAVMPHTARIVREKTPSTLMTRRNLYAASDSLSNHRLYLCLTAATMSRS